MPPGEVVEVVVQDEDAPVVQPPGLPGADDEHAHPADSSDGAAVVVCSRDRPQLLADALAAVRAALRAGDELVVVDSASRSAATRRVAGDAGARVLRCERPGLSRARNLGWRASTQPFVLFTDDDCRPSAGWVQQAVHALREPGTGAVWGRVTAAGEGAAGLSILDEDTPAELRPGSPLSAAGHGANMAFRREALAAVGGFDPWLGVGARFGAGEDKDVFWRLVRAGYGVRYAPQAVVSHLAWRGDAQALRVTYRYGLGAGAITAKRRRIAGDRGLVAEECWRFGLLPAARALRRRQWTTGAAALARTAGVLTGATLARRYGVADGILQGPHG